ncbi:MAG: hypothetical protein HY365_02360 [Candidatus Aenigmarchaeota archaeon]|nr:hypothetical protein [Candidatus Aenigmarchaeota archaeon]
MDEKAFLLILTIVIATIVVPAYNMPLITLDFSYGRPDIQVLQERVTIARYIALATTSQETVGAIDVNVVITNSGNIVYSKTFWVTNSKWVFNVVHPISEGDVMTIEVPYFPYKQAFELK